MISGFDGSQLSGFNGSADPAQLAWLMFMQTGMPGLYMLYSNLEHGEERGIFD